MKAKAVITLFIVANCFASCLSSAALRRTPKVYNALITTDENLNPSRAYPVIQPTIHETGISHYPFGPYSGFGYYNPPVVRFGQPIAPGLAPREQLAYPVPHMQFSPQLMQHLPPHLQGQPGFPGYPTAQNPPTAPAATENVQQTLKKPEIAPTDQQQPIVPPKDAPAQPQDPKYIPIDVTGPQEMPNEKLPILLNEYGLPPSLIPLQQYPIIRNGSPNPNRNHINLPPYAYNQHPLLPGYYDPVNGFREHYLPPYDYPASPHQTYALAAEAAKKATAANTIPPAGTAPIEPQTEETSNSNPETTEPKLESKPASLDAAAAPDLESIKNGSTNKNSDVPDVPPPPIPSGAKTKSSS